jgi:4-hydroxythreonine-4-phosphate dehydrogenase
MLELCTPVIFCQCENNVIHKKEFRVSCSLHGIDKLDQIVPGRLMFWIFGKKGRFEPGVNDDKVGQYAVKHFIATDALQEGVDVLVTAQ